MSLHAHHWQDIYARQDEMQTSWYRPHLDTSLRLIDGLKLPADAAFIDVGAGRATLVDDLLARGFRDVAALDVSAAALAQSRRRMGPSGDLVRWMNHDLFEAKLPADRYDLWHDRAVFHFLVNEKDQASYAELAARSIRGGGHLLIATFAPDGPERCSNMKVCRYDAASLAARFAPDFELVAEAREDHRTPMGTVQPFTYLLLRRVKSADTEPEFDPDTFHDPYAE
jgi:SAM-dependent methyltransferase